jgi:hypothetical protein
VCRKYAQVEPAEPVIVIRARRTMNVADSITGRTIWTLLPQTTIPRVEKGASDSTGHHQQHGRFRHGGWLNRNRRQRIGRESKQNDKNSPNRLRHLSAPGLTRLRDGRSRPPSKNRAESDMLRNLA